MDGSGRKEVFSLPAFPSTSSSHPELMDDCRLDVTVAVPHPHTDPLVALSTAILNIRPCDNSPFRPSTESPADVGRDEAHPVLPVLLMPLSEKPVTEKHATGTHALCSEVHASTGCAGRHSSLSVVALPLTLWHSFLICYMLWLCLLITL